MLDQRDISSFSKSSKGRRSRPLALHFSFSISFPLEKEAYDQTKQIPDL